MKHVIDFLLNNDKAETPKRGNKELKSITIDGRKFRYNKGKPISNVLNKKLKSVTNTNEYNSHATRTIRSTYLKQRMKNALTKYVIENKFRITDQQSAFKSYANSIKLENKHFQGEKALSMIHYQNDRLLNFLKNNRAMKLNIRAQGLFYHYFDDGEKGVLRYAEIVYNLPATRSNVYNETDLDEAIEKSIKENLLNIEKLEGSVSNLQLIKILSITIHYDKYDPTRAGSYIDLPEWIKLRKACINIKNKDNTCFYYSVQSVVYDINNKPNSQEMFHYNKLNDDILNWEGVKFPTGNKDIERFEENHSKLVSTNVYEIDDILNDKNSN